ncbi:MAG: TadE/TadG family type IV pilus assembly protein [Rhizomicrobium sp.]
MLLIPRLSLTLRRFVQSHQGVVAVEFAMILPILLLMFFATLELATAFDCRTRVTDAAASTADLIAQRSSVGATDLSNILCATKAMIYPYPTSGAIKMVVTSIRCTSGSSSCSAAGVYWSGYTSNTAARTAVPATSALPLTIFPSSGAGVVMTELSYTYTPPLTNFLTGPITMRWTAYAIPRSSGTAVGSSASSTNFVIADCSLAS